MEINTPEELKDFLSKNWEQIESKAFRSIIDSFFHCFKMTTFQKPKDLKTALNLIDMAVESIESGKVPFGFATSGNEEFNFRRDMYNLGIFGQPKQL